MNLPNQITTARLVIALVLFGVLSFVPPQKKIAEESYNPSSESDIECCLEEESRYSLLLDICFCLFVIGGISDYLDGYFARKYNMISTFGRIADPFVDKILVCGTFIFFIRLTPLVTPWMVVIIIGREMLVSALRSFMEGQKIAFGAQSAGKFKMIFQCFTIGSIFLYLSHFRRIPYMDWAIWSLLWITVIITLSSMFGYIRGSYKIMKS